MEYCLETEYLIKNYRNFHALNGLTMHVPRGAIYGLIGKNGAGKTTLIRIICGLQNPSGGSYSLYGERFDGRGIYKARSRMGGVVETPSVYANMTAYENIKQQFMLLGKPSFDGIDELLKLVRLDDTGKKKAGHFSLGMKQRLGIAIALAGNPDFIVLDEPVNGLDPQGIVEIRELILKLNREKNITFLVSSHILGELSKIATHYGFVHKGEILKEITAQELKDVCRKCLSITVTNPSALAPALDFLKLEYRLTAENKADVYGDVDLTEFGSILKLHGVTLLHATEKDEDLESYYINLIGGDLNG